jgi:hypothetical protein
MDEKGTLEMIFKMHYHSKWECCSLSLSNTDLIPSLSMTEGKWLENAYSITHLCLVLKTDIQIIRSLVVTLLLRMPKN